MDTLTNIFITLILCQSYIFLGNKPTYIGQVQLESLKNMYKLHSKYYRNQEHIFVFHEIVKKKEVSIRGRATTKIIYQQYYYTSNELSSIPLWK